MDKAQKREIKRIRHILDEIVSMAEDEELQGGISSAVKRYNAIVRHVESIEVVPHELFQPLEEEGSISFSQVGVESRMLSSYLEGIAEEEEEEGKPDFSPVIALAPFLDQSDLKALVHSHLSGRGFREREEERKPVSSEGPDLQTLVGLAPHLSKKDLGELVEGCLAREPLREPHLLLALAPHLDRQDLGRLLRRYSPGWFGEKTREDDRYADTRPYSEPPAPPVRPDPPSDVSPALEQHPFGAADPDSV